MKYLKQLLIILAFCLMGELLQALIPLPVPAAIYGLVLLLVALCAGLLKPERIAETANFLVQNMGILFVAPTVNILRYWDIISPFAAQIILIIAASTFAVFTVSGLVTRLLLKKCGERNG